jgi:ABC-type amino acid transport substrate-binding protein
MKKLSFITILFLAFTNIKSQGVDSLVINYYEDFPYAYTVNGKLTGIEIDIVDEYVNWLKQKKNLNVVVSYKRYTEFSAFYSGVKNGSAKVIGLGSVTMNAEREKEVAFSAPYLQNVAVLITAGKIPTIRNKTKSEVEQVLGKLKGLAVAQSSHVNYMNQLKKEFLPSLVISNVETQNNLLENILSDNTNFGYVDIVAYWAFLKNNPSKFLKMQKVFSEPKESLGFALPKNSAHASYLNEFFESGFGFTSTKVYHQILEKYLGYEIIESVEIK